MEMGTSMRARAFVRAARARGDAGDPRLQVSRHRALLNGGTASRERRWRDERRLHGHIEGKAATSSRPVRASGELRGEVRPFLSREQRKFEQFLEFAPDAIVGVAQSSEIALVNLAVIGIMMFKGLEGALIAPRMPL
jgi:hypothetical protein